MLCCSFVILFTGAKVLKTHTHTHLRHFTHVLTTVKKQKQSKSGCTRDYCFSLACLAHESTKYESCWRSHHDTSPVIPNSGRRFCQMKAVKAHDTDTCFMFVSLETRRVFRRTYIFSLFVCFFRKSGSVCRHCTHSHKMCNGIYKKKHTKETLTLTRPFHSRTLPSSDVRTRSINVHS